MLRSDYRRVNFKFGLSSIMGIRPFRRRRQGAGQKSMTSVGAVSAEWSQTFWGRKFIKSATLVLALMCSASIVLADIKITTKSTSSGQSFTSTTYIKGARQRIEGMGYTTIYQCDQKRMIQINDKTRSYLITPLADKSEAARGAGAQSAGARRGGVITYTTTSTDTGERKTMMGLTARYIKSKTVITASEGACTPMNMEMESDGWYVDLPGGASCPTDAGGAPVMPVEQSECVDEVRYKTEGTAKMGYPVMTTTRIKFNAGDDGPAMNIPPTTSLQEVVDLSKVPLDAALFEIPAGYREVKSAQELGSPY